MPSATLRAHHALDVDAVFDQLDVVGDLTGELDLAAAQRPAAAGRAAPAEEETGHLPQRVEPEATRHHRVALEVAFEEPEVRSNVELGPHLAAIMAAASVVDAGDAVEHQHGRERQLGIAGAEKLAASAGEELFVGIGVLALRHQARSKWLM